MSEELRETVEILRIGSDFTLKILDITKESIQALFAVGNSMLIGKAGRTSFKNVMKNCAENGTSPVPLSFPSEDKQTLEQAENMLKKMNVQFARLPDYIQGDNQTQYLVSTEHVHFFNLVAKKMYENELADIKKRGGSMQELTIKSDACNVHEGNEYAGLVPKEDLEKAKMEAINLEGKENLPSSEEYDKEAISKLMMSARNEQTKYDPNYKRISIDKESLLKSIDNENITFTIPGTKGKEFVSFRRDEIVASDKQCFVFNINRREHFSIRNKSGDIIKTYTGDDFLKYFSKAKTVNDRNKNINDKTIKQNRKPIQKKGGR